MPKRIVSRCIGFASTVGFTAIVTGHPSLEQKKANILAGAAAVFTGEKIIDSITTSSSFKPTPLEDTFLQSSKIIDVNRNLAPPDTNIVSDRITHVLNNVSSLIDSEKNTLCHNTNDEEQFSIVYNQFIRPFIEQGPTHIGSMELYNTTTHYFKQIIETTPDVNSVYYMALNALAAIFEARNIYIKTLQQQTEINNISGRYDQALTKIHKLAQKIKDLTGEIDGAFGGSIGLVVTPPKPTIYALAILNPTHAWYIYINGNGTIDSQLFIAVEQYVKSLDNPTAELHKLLDEKFRTLTKDLGNIRLTTSSIPCTSSSNKNTSSNSICTTSSYDSDDSDDSCQPYNNNPCVNPSLMPRSTICIWNPDTQKMETAFTLSGNLNITTNPQLSTYSKKNKTCTRRKKHHRTTQKHCNTSAILQPCFSNFGDVLILPGKLDISINSKFKQNKTRCRRKKYYRRRSRKNI